MVDIQKLIEETRKMRREEGLITQNPYPRTFQKIREDKGYVYQRGEETYCYVLERGCLEGKIEVREDEYIFRGNAFNNLLEGTQMVFMVEKGEEKLHFTFDIFEGVIKNRKTRKKLEEEKEKKINGQFVHL